MGPFQQLVKNAQFKIVYLANRKMNIYDKSSRVKKGRTKVYDNAQGVDNNFWSFQPAKAGNYYIEYDVPKSIDGKVKTGCVVLLI